MYKFRQAGRKFLTFVSLLSIVTQSLSPYLYVLPRTAYAQEASSETDQAQVSPTPEVSPVAEPTQEVTPAPSPQDTGQAEEPTVTPEPTIEVTPVVEPTNEPTVAPAENQENNNSPPSDDSSNQDSSPTVTQEPTPTKVPAQEGNGDLSIAILDNTAASSIDLEAYESQGSASLVTDKPDYAPTDTAIITGNGFNSGETYILVITSQDEPPVRFETQVTADENGTFVYVYQLDGNYRPNYKVKVKSPEGITIASATFTDSDETAQAHIVVRKITNPEGSGQQFDFFLNDENEFSLSGGGERTFDVNEGTYTIRETVPPGWVLSDISCEYDNESVGESAPPSGETVTVDSGDTVTCTFTNSDTAAPTLESAETQDTNENGKIDTIRLTFSENINDSFLNIGEADGWDVDGYDGEAIGTGENENDNVLLLTFAESGDPDTGNKPAVSYSSSEDEDTSTHDLAGNELASNDWNSDDDAAPISSITYPEEDASYTEDEWDGEVQGTAEDNFSTGINSVLVSIQRDTDSAYWDADEEEWVIGVQEEEEYLNEADFDGENGTWGFDFEFIEPEGADEGYIVRSHAVDNAENQENTTEVHFFFERAPIISGETSTSVTASSATITWDTDFEATSRVIYDTVSHAVLGSAPKYGYASSTDEFDADPKVTSHSVAISGLSAGTTYFYRTVSHGSPDAVGDEKNFATTSPAVSSATTGGGGSGGGTASAPSCEDAKPGSAPTLTGASAGANSVTLTWSEALDPVSYYLVTYGISSGAQTFGNPNVGGKGTTSYTVSGLSGGITYYFRVRAGNGCKPGDYSNELSVTPGGEAVTGPAAGFAPGVLGEETKSGEIKGEATGEKEQKESQKPMEKGGLLFIVAAVIALLYALYRRSKKTT